MRNQVTQERKVTVVGAGVIGLTCGVRLREAGVDARIVARELPDQTTSAAAAAVWYPYLAYPEGRVLAWGRRSLQVFEELS
ncbi:MAG: FAD-dependent oxidoreductase, partial [Acidimicrobiia bacterium]